MYDVQCWDAANNEWDRMEIVWTKAAAIKSVQRLGRAGYTARYVTL